MKHTNTKGGEKVRKLMRLSVFGIAIGMLTLGLSSPISNAVAATSKGAHTTKTTAGMSTPSAQPVVQTSLAPSPTVHYYANDAASGSNYFGPALNSSSPQAALADMQQRRTVDPALTVADAYYEGLPGFAGLSGDAQFTAKIQELISNPSEWKSADATLNSQENGLSPTLTTMSGQYQTLYMVPQGSNPPLIRSTSPDKTYTVLVLSSGNTVYRYQVECGGQPRTPIAAPFQGVVQAPSPAKITQTVNVVNVVRPVTTVTVVCSNLAGVNGNGNSVSQGGNCNTTPPSPVCPCTHPIVPVQPVCPTGTTGTPPNCVTPPVCPEGTTGTPPNCVTPPCKCTSPVVPPQLPPQGANQGPTPGAPAQSPPNTTVVPDNNQAGAPNAGQPAANPTSLGSNSGASDGSGTPGSTSTSPSATTTVGSNSGGTAFDPGQGDTSSGTTGITSGTPANSGMPSAPTIG